MDAPVAEALYVMDHAVDSPPGQLAPERCRFGAGGEFHPVEPNATLAGRQANRRVEIIVVK